MVNIHSFRGLGRVEQKINFHRYADDTLIYLSTKPVSSWSPEDMNFKVIPFVFMNLI